MWQILFNILEGKDLKKNDYSERSTFEAFENNYICIKLDAALTMKLITESLYPLYEIKRAKPRPSLTISNFS